MKRRLLKQIIEPLLTIYYKAKLIQYISLASQCLFLVVQVSHAVRPAYQSTDVVLNKAPEHFG